MDQPTDEKPDLAPEAVSDVAPETPTAPVKSPELVHAEAELARLRDEIARHVWENGQLKNGVRYLAGLTEGDLHEDPGHVAQYAFTLLKKVAR